MNVGELVELLNGYEDDADVLDEEGRLIGFIEGEDNKVYLLRDA